MKILQINKYFYQKGGAETVFFNTIDLLERNNHIVLPFCLKSEKNKKTQYDSYFVDYPELSESGLYTKIKHIPSFLYNKDAVRKLEKLLVDERPDVAHIHLLFNSLSVSILPVLAKHKIPIVMSVHDYRLICPAYTFRNGKGDICEACIKSKQYWKCITNRCSKGNIANSILLSADSYFRKGKYSPLNYIDKFIFVSQFALNKHIEASEKYKNKSTVLYNFTSITSTEKKEKKDYFLYFGRISEEKGIETLIKVFKDNPSIKLKIVGTGPLLKQLSKDCPSNITFEGFKSGEELYDYIKNAYFVIVPSEWYENNPLTIIESFALGTPVIGSRIGGIPELITEDETGYLFDAGSTTQLEIVLRKSVNLHNAKYTDLCVQAKKFAANNFSRETHYQRLFAIYESII